MTVETMILGLVVVAFKALLGKILWDNMAMRKEMNNIKSSMAKEHGEQAQWFQLLKDIIVAHENDNVRIHDALEKDALRTENMVKDVRDHILVYKGKLDARIDNEL